MRTMRAAEQAKLAMAAGWLNRKRGQQLLGTLAQHLMHGTNVASWAEFVEFLCSGAWKGCGLDEAVRYIVIAAIALRMEGCDRLLGLAAVQ